MAGRRTMTSEPSSVLGDRPNAISVCPTPHGRSGHPLPVAGVNGGVECAGGFAPLEKGGKKTRGGTGHTPPAANARRRKSACSAGSDRASTVRYTAARNANNASAIAPTATVNGESHGATKIATNDAPGLPNAASAYPTRPDATAPTVAPSNNG